MATLDDIKAALTAIDDEVHYGTAFGHDPAKPWDYTVFSREDTEPKDNNTSYSERYMVAVVREDYVPEGMYREVIKAVTALPGVRIDDSQRIEYVYDTKPGGAGVVEMMVMHFRKNVKA